MAVVESRMRALVLTLLVLCASAQADAATRYVDNASTSCSNPDTDYTPATRTCGSGSAAVYSTIAAGITPTACGDTLYIRGGTVYTEGNVSIDSRSCSDYGSGAMLVKGYPGDARPIHRPSSNPANNVWALGASSTTQYVIVEGLEMDGVNQVFSGSSLSGVYFGSFADHVKFSDNRVFRAQFSNILCDGTSNDLWITGNYIEEAGRGVQEGDQEHGIYCSGANQLIEHNEITLSSSAGITTYSGSQNGSTYRYNVIYHNAQVQVSGTGIELASCTSGCAIYGNVIYGESDGNGNGITVYSTSSNVVIYNNTMYGFNDGIAIQGGSGHTVRNNIMVQNSGSDFTDSGTGTTKNNNLCDSGCDEAGGAPTFENAAGGDFRLAVGSNGIDDGATIGSPYDVDILGVSRPQGSAWDLGAYEYAVASAADRLRLR